ncbi:Receptor-type tyrosine-protein phosphatase F, partial [Exaiptasia diaphana]
PDCPPKLKSVEAVSSTSIRVTWDPPPNTNCRNGILRGYKVIYRRPGDRYWKMSNLVLPSNGRTSKVFRSTTYMFKVVAYTIKDSEPSKTIARKTSQDAPDCPPKLKSVEAVSSTSIRVTWDPPPNTSCRNGILRGYKVLYRRPGDRNWQMSNVAPTVQWKDIANLQKYTLYMFKVVAYTVKDSEPSNTITRMTLQDAPDCPPKLKSVEAVSSTIIRVAWDPLPNTNCRNGILRGYKVFYRRPGDRYWKMSNVGTAVKRKDVKSLQKYTTYMFKVVAYTVKDSEPSKTITRKTSQDAPDCPPKLKSVEAVSSTSIRVTWDPPPNTSCRNGILRGYKVLYERPGDRNWQTAKAGLFFKGKDITNLQKYTTYMFKVVAYTVKDSEPSNARTRTTLQDVPDVASYGIRVLKQNETTFTIAWKPLQKNEANGNITEYKVVWVVGRFGRPKRMTVADSFTETTQRTQFVLHSLRPCAQYEVRVAAATSIGLGPIATINITTSREFEKFKTYWPAYSSSFQVKSKHSSQTTTKIKELLPGTHYEFWVIALTICGVSNKSLAVTVEAEVDKPRTPQQAAPLKLKDSFNVTLWTFKPYNGPIRILAKLISI